MIKKIATHQLCLGMFVHELSGSWLKHPFWKSAFLITHPDQITQIQRSGIGQVSIDTKRGCDVAAAVDEPQATDALDAATLEAPPARAQAPLPESCTMSEEMARAGHIVAQARGAMTSMFQDARLGKAIDTEHCLPLVNDITQSVSRNPGAIVSLARLKTSDDYTYMHSVAVCALMVTLARQLGLSEEDTREAGMAGLVHDLGKALMPIEVLNKPGALTPEEFIIMKSHPQAGHELLQEGRGVGPIPMDVCLHHHEKMNGLGYPHGLKDNGISLFARMGAVCDVYDAITSTRPYKSGWDPADSVQKMALWARDGHFDQAVFQAFVKSIGIYPVGSLVRLQSNRLGVIVAQSPDTLLTPMVKAFYRADTRELCEVELLDLSQPTCPDRIVARETPEQWGLTDLDRYWTSLS